MSTVDVQQLLRRVPPPAVELATLVSIAARIEPELLRAMRVELLLHHADTSAEADLWFSGLSAARSTRRMVLRPKVAAVLREKLTQDRTLLDRARAVVERMHAAAAPAVRLEEEITYLALTGDADAPGKIQERLTAVMNSIVTENRAGLVDWAARALPGMPALVHQTSAAQMLAFVTGPAGLPVELSKRLPDDPVLSSLLARAVPQTTVYVRLVPVGDGVPNGVEISTTETPGAHALAVPRTDPIVLELEQDDDWIVVALRERELRAAPGDHVTIRTLANEEYVLARREEEEDARTEMRPITILATSSAPFEVDSFKREPIDLLLVAGDLAQSAFQKEYRRTLERLTGIGSKLITVPGPYDAEPTSSPGLEGAPSEATFDTYLQFRPEHAFPGALVPGDFHTTIEIDGCRIGIAGLNSAYRHSRHGSYDPAQLLAVCDGYPELWFDSHHFTILLMHHGPDHLDEESQAAFREDRYIARFGLRIFGSEYDDFARMMPHDGGASLFAPPILERNRFLGLTILRQENYASVQVRYKQDEPAPVQFTMTLHEPGDGIYPRIAAGGLRVLIAGTASGLSVDLEELSRAVGAMLAEEKCELLTGGATGVDFLVAEGFEKAGGSESDIRHFLGQATRPDYGRGVMMHAGSEEESIRRSVAVADVLIVLEGKGGTMRVAEAALERHKPVIPVGDGAAEKILQRAMSWSPLRFARFEILRNPQAAVSDQVAAIRSLLHVIPSTGGQS